MNIMEDSDRIKMRVRAISGKVKISHVRRPSELWYESKGVAATLKEQPDHQSTQLKSLDKVLQKTEA